MSHKRDNIKHITSSFCIIHGALICFYKQMHAHFLLVCLNLCWPLDYLWSPAPLRGHKLAALGSAGSHPAVIVFMLCFCTNKHMGARIGPFPGHPHGYCLITPFLEPRCLSTHHGSLLLKELPSWLSVDLEGQNYQLRSLGVMFTFLICCSRIGIGHDGSLVKPKNVFHIYYLNKLFVSDAINRD